jgi:gas vesicle protein
MKKLLGLLLGFMVGAALGATLVVLLSPVSGDQLIRNLKQGYAETMSEARTVSEKRRAELEAELARMRRTR